MAIIGNRLLRDTLADAMGFAPERPEVPDAPSAIVTRDLGSTPTATAQPFAAPA